jgi:hypothetical protein
MAVLRLNDNHRTEVSMWVDRENRWFVRVGDGKVAILNDEQALTMEEWIHARVRTRSAAELTRQRDAINLAVLQNRLERLEEQVRCQKDLITELIGRIPIRGEE